MLNGISSAPIPTFENGNTQEAAGAGEPEPIDISGVVHGGSGIGRVQGRVCLVPHGLPGDRVRVRVKGRRRGVLWAVIEEVLEPSPHRADTPCPAFGQCGGCAWLHFGYPGQGEWKRRIVIDCLRRIGGLEADPEWVEEPSLRLGYRTRAKFHSDGVAWGFLAQGSHRVIDISSCPLCHPALNKAFGLLRSLRRRTTVELIVNPEGEEILAWLFKPDPALREVFPLTNWPRQQEPRAQFLFDGVPIVNGVFSQSSLLLNRPLVRTVHEMVHDAGCVLDLYCGNGNLSLGLAARMVQVLGLDHNNAGVQAAAALGTGEYRVAGEKTFARILQEGQWDIVLLDPPRIGAKAIVPALLRSNVSRLVYVSCDPATLARDLRPLAASGWRLTRVVAVDMFPHTPHIETVCRLER